MLTSDGLNKNIYRTKIMTVDNLFIFHGKVSLIHGLGRVSCKGHCFLKSMNNKSTDRLLKK